MTETDLARVKIVECDGGFKVEIQIGGPRETVGNVLPFSTREAALEWAEKRIRKLGLLE